MSTHTNKNELSTSQQDAFYLWKRHFHQPNHQLHKSQHQASLLLKHCPLDQAQKIPKKSTLIKIKNQVKLINSNNSNLNFQRKYQGVKVKAPDHNDFYL